MPKQLFLKTYGCQMNVYDSARIADVLALQGYSLCDSPQTADLVVLNTCHIREKAAEKVYSELGRLQALQRERRADGGDLRIAVAGCVAQAEGEEMRRRAPFVDAVVGPQAYHRIGEMIAAVERGTPSVDTEFPAESKFDVLPQVRASGLSSFLTIQEGCDKFCTFCVVPYTRGAEYSRPVADVLAEATTLAAQGARELTLLGQNVNAYHGELPKGGTASLGDLLRRLADIPGIARLRYTTSHPRDVDRDLAAAHRDVAEVMPYVHLPVQSGADRVLAAMNRRHTADDYRRAVAMLRHARGDLAISGDFIVGFPGETDAEFQDTLRLVRDVGYADAFAFKFSPRPGTPAADMAPVAEEVASARLEELLAELTAQRIAFDRRVVGTTVPVLFERPGRRPGQIGGRTPHLQAVHVDAPESHIGSITEVEIIGLGGNSLVGRIVAAGAREAAA